MKRCHCDDCLQCDLRLMAHPVEPVADAPPPTPEERRRLKLGGKQLAQKAAAESRAQRARRLARGRIAP